MCAGGLATFHGTQPNGCGAQFALAGLVGKKPVRPVFRDRKQSDDSDGSATLQCAEKSGRVRIPPLQKKIARNAFDAAQAMKIGLLVEVIDLLKHSH